MNKDEIVADLLDEAEFVAGQRFYTGNAEYTKSVMVTASNLIEEQDKVIEMMRVVLEYVGKTYQCDESRLIHSEADIAYKVKLALSKALPSES